MALSSFTLVALLSVATAWPVDISSSLLEPRQLQASNETLVSYSIPSKDLTPTVRAAGIETKRTTFTYGPGVDGGPFTPNGSLGLTYVTAGSLPTDAELVAETTISLSDMTKAQADSAKYNGLQTVDDYTNLYDGEWGPSSQPTGIDPGMLSNYTSDLLFSMSRLSFSPFALRRLNSSKDTLPFSVDDASANKIAGSTLQSLFSSGRLFYIDHRAQGQLQRTSRYAPACDGYFYLSSNSTFLPLAIRTNVGNNLIYTPLDTANDWLLAKMMFEVNDFYFAQLDHLARTHYVAEIAYDAAVRTLSDEHPVLGLLNRLMYGAFGVRPIAALVLFNDGGIFDSYFGYTGAASRNFTDQLYFNGYAGSFEANYFETNLRSRGLIDAGTGPALPHFPFYEDAKAVHDAIHGFVTSFIASYYSSDSQVAADKEIQAWTTEARGPAQAVGFPSQLGTSAQLVDAVTHIAYLVSVAHHSVNLNQLITGAGVYPLHIQALYQPVPTAKGATNLTRYMPPLDQCINFITVAARFSRPLLANTPRTLSNMFNDPAFLALTNDDTRAANDKFIAAMNTRSAEVSSRGFDAQGLSQGMPFVWKALDPNVAPWSLSI